MDSISYVERLLATIVRAFLETGNQEHATLLATCEITRFMEYDDDRTGEYDDWPIIVKCVDISIGGSAIFCRTFDDTSRTLRKDFEYYSVCVKDFETTS